MAAAALDFRILGPLEVANGSDDPVRISAGKPRALLAALLLNANEVVGSDRLADALWGERPPASAEKLVQTYVVQLRRSLANGVIETRAPGYVLRIDPGQVDAARFERLFAEGREALAAGNAALAASLLRRALALWRGRALADVAHADFARVEAERLEELRLDCLEQRIEAELALGRHDDLLAELRSLAAAHPLRERPTGQLALALYRCGRQTDALDAIAAASRRFREELGLEPGPRLRELERRILRHDPTLALDRRQPDGVGSLPLPPNALVGRERERAQLSSMLTARDSRLVVLTGAGGSGKTRLALEVAREVAPSFANGAALVELAALDDPALVLPAVGHALGVADVSAQGGVEAVMAAARDLELLLVVDNAEHVRSVAPLFVELLARAPRLTLLVTSRAVLHVSGERVFPVAPLGPENAVELFEQRARLLQPSFAVTPANAADIAEICRRLDGLPLAIELAAARTRTLVPRALLQRLDTRLTVVTAGPRDLPARQQTLRETLDWSANLLSAAERRVLAGLALFPGGCTLEAAEAVCGADVDTLSALVDESLVTRVERGGEPRFVLLETIREYALERLPNDGLDEARRRYAEWYVALAERAELELTGERQTAWFATLEAEHDNLRAALVLLADDSDAEARLRLTIALTRFWYVRGYLSEARRWLDDALTASDGGAPLALRRRALTAASAVALLQGDYAAAMRFSERGLAAARETGEPLYVANALSNLGAIVLAAGDLARAGTLLGEAVPLARETGDRRVLALALNNLGDLALTVGDYERARPLFEESLALLRERGDTSNVARSLFNLGAVALMLGDHGDARVRLTESLALCDAAGDKEDVAWCLEGFAGLAAAAGQGERAALLLGAATTVLEGMGAARKPFERKLHADTDAAARALCEADTFDVARARGAGMTLEEAREHALGAS